MENNICVEIISMVVNAFLSFVTIIVAVKALKQTKKQIELSNKHKLFDRRLKMYLILVDLLNLFCNSKNMLKGNSDLLNSVILEIRFLTKSQIFYDLFDKNDATKINDSAFNDSYNKLKKYSEEAGILWDNEDGKLASDFIRLYSEVLLALFQQNYCIEAHSKIPEPEKSKNKDNLETKREKFAEDNGLFVKIDDIYKLYDKIEKSKVTEKLKETIKLED